MFMHIMIWRIIFSSFRKSRNFIQEDIRAFRRIFSRSDKHCPLFPGARRGRRFKRSSESCEPAICLRKMYSNACLWISWGFSRQLPSSCHGSIESVYLNGDNYHYQNVIRLNSLEMTERMFLEFADIFFNAFFIPYKSEHSDILKKTFCYIDDNIDKPIQLASVAQAIGISESYLSTFFKREIGKSFVTYVTARKLEKAKLLLQKGDLAYQVSEALGFENYSYFSKVFKKYIGITPDAFRRQFVSRRDK